MKIHMKKPHTFVILSLVLLSCTGQEIPDKETQIAQAVLAAPLHQQVNASVLGYDLKGELVTLRQGSNDFICVADDPSKEGFSVAAYHKSLEEFMNRGRELRKQGLNATEIFEKREEEVAAGDLSMPDKTTLYVTSGELDPDTGEVENLYTRYVIYIPYATEESTGMPLKPIAPGAPWIMDPGTHRAHIMINPPKSN